MKLISIIIGKQSNFENTDNSEIKLTEVIPLTNLAWSKNWSVYKSDDKKVAANYRPISLLSKIAQILEKIILKSTLY